MRPDGRLKKPGEIDNSCVREEIQRLASHDIPIGSTQVSLAQLSDRSRDIFRQIVESYLATGEPVGSRNISRLLQMSLSPASVRNVMSDLEQLGLIYAPHTSAGRLPTELGLRFFVDALMQIGDINDNDKRAIEAQVAGRGQSYENVLTQASGLLSGLTRAAGVVLTAKLNVHAQAYRVRPARARARAGRAGCRRRAGRKPYPAGPGRIADLGADRSIEFSQCAHSRQDASASCGSRLEDALEAGPRRARSAHPEDRGAGICELVGRRQSTSAS